MSTSRLMKVYNSLPPEGQQMFVEKHLVGLLDAVPKDKSKKVMIAATRLQTKYKAAPKLDLRAKKRQIGNLLLELARDAKCSIVKERSNRDELLFETFYGLVGWLNAIWSVVYEYNVQFATAHASLLFVVEALAQLSETCTLGGCKCTVMNLPVDFQLKDRNGKVLKRFAITGPQNIERILLWIWRDLFISLSLNGSEKDKARIPEFLKELGEIMGLGALEKLLSGGQPTEFDEEWEDDDFEDIYDSDVCDEDHDDEEDDLEEGSDGGGSHSRCQCRLHASYWSEKLNKERASLRDRVVSQLLEVFKTTPSVRLYNSLMGTTTFPGRIESVITKVLLDIAGDSSDNLVAALDIHISMNSCPRVVFLLDKYMHLLRPRDVHALSSAVVFLSSRQEHRARTLAILETELEDSFQALHAAIRSCFSGIDDEPNKAEITEILKLKGSKQARKSRIEQWAERAITNSSSSMGPMAFAAMMMGFPILPGVDEGEDLDMLSYLDLDQNDPDMEDVRDEYRPNLKARFSTWVDTGSRLMGGPAVVMKFCGKVLERMPYIQASDVVNEMTTRLGERPNKSHVVDAINCIATFAKTQRKKIALAREKKLKTAAAPTPSNSNQAKSNPGKSNGKANSSGVAGNPQPPAPPPPALPSASRFTFAPPLAPASLPALPRGMEDVD